MNEQPPERKTVQPASWLRVLGPLSVVLGLAAVVCRRDAHLSWPGTALVLVGIVAATGLWWWFATRKLVPSLANRPRTWQTRSGHLKLKVTVRCKSCGNSVDMSGAQSDSCPSCGEEIGHAS